MKINMSEFKIGELIVFKSHPYIDKHTEIKIAAYSDYTSPVLVIKQIKEKSQNKEKGKDIVQELNCLYYSSRDGKFIDRWISSNLVNKIFFTTSDHKLLFDIDFKRDLDNLNKDYSAIDYENLIKESYFNKMVILKSVDIELNKKKVNRTKDNGELVETNHLEFLPPVMTIVGYKFIDEKNKFCKNTGLPLIDLKCKWYNSSLKTFSELIFPYHVLYHVKEVQNLSMDKDLLSDISESLTGNTFFLLPLKKPFELEGYADKEIARTIGYPTAILYKHYFYQMNYFDYVTQNKATINIDDDFEKGAENAIFGKKYPSYERSYRSKVSDCRFKIDSYYVIVYKDMYENITRRVVKIRDLLIHIKKIKEFTETYDQLSSWNPSKNFNLFNYNYGVNGMISIISDTVSIPDNRLPKSIFNDENVEIFLNTNCLLRQGRYRNFNVNRILEVIEIIDGQGFFESSYTI